MDFIETLKGASVQDDETFTRIINLAAEVLELDDMAISKLFDVSRPTVRRWKEGRTTPYPAARRLIFRDLEKLARACSQD